MNNYYNYNNFYREEKFPYESLDNIYDPYQGFIRGNMYPQLYNTYRFTKPVELSPTSEQSEWMLAIQSLSFACHDLNLYLDLHPENLAARKLFEQYNVDLTTFISYYENKYGPLFVNDDNLQDNSWGWIKSPWPWESI